MEDKIIKLTKKAREILGEDADFLIIAHDKQNCGVKIHGNIEKIAESFFANIFSKNQRVGNLLYKILKLNALNILKNQSPYAVDFAESIVNLIPEDNEEIQQIQQQGC